MTGYEFSLTGADTTRKGGATQPVPHGSEGSSPGGAGAVPAVCGTSTPVVAAGGATNDGEDNLPRVRK